VVIGGMALSTLVTLVLVPAAYLSANGLVAKVRARWSWTTGRGRRAGGRAAGA
jgi:hypothetical protein